MGCSPAHCWAARALGCGSSGPQANQPAAAPAAVASVASASLRASAAGVANASGTPPAAESAKTAADTPQLAKPAEAAHGRAPAPRGKTAANELGPRESARSALAAEVLALDAARAAALRGESDEALRLIARYHADFPNGSLSADADAVAIETLSAAGRSSAAARLAAQFWQSTRTTLTRRPCKKVCHER